MFSLRAILFSLTLLVSSFLLFMVQPMIGRMLLPSLGGTPAVWNGCVLFFQTVLLAGYAWAHYGPPRLGTRTHLIIHLCLLAIVTLLLPMQLMTGWAVSDTAHPLIWLMGQLTLCVGLPFFVISSSAPLLQRWFTESDPESDASEPWFLYAVSNVGSISALLLYPFVFERIMGLTQQGWFWTIGFSLLCLLFACCAAQTLRSNRLTRSRGERRRAGEAIESAKPLTWNQRLTYIALAAIPSSLMLGVTTIVSTEVGSFPLMWSIPLTLYLLTFVFVFANRQVIPHRWMVRLMPMMLLLMAFYGLSDMGQYPLVSLIAQFGTFFVVAMVCHGELALKKPDVSQLTEYFLMMSIGGVCGGLLNSIIAPLAFDRIVEYPLMLIAACLLMPQLKGLKHLANRNSAFVWPTWDSIRESFRQRVWLVPVAVLAWVLIVDAASSFIGLNVNSYRMIALIVVPLVLAYTQMDRPRVFAACFAVIALLIPSMRMQSEIIDIERGFFGVNEVTVDRDREFRTLINGITVHGKQRVDQTNSTQMPDPLMYYHRDGSIGEVFALHGDDQQEIAVVGLGVGSVAAYSQPGQTLDFFEIDPTVIRIASNPEYFNFLSSARGEVNLILGDARLQLDQRREHAGPMRNVAFSANDFTDHTRKKYGMIILDAFGSDSVPVHLMTAEAFQLYFDLLEEDGLLVVHISNKFIDFVPILAAASENLNLHAIHKRDAPDAAAQKTGHQPSHYAVLSRHQNPVNEFRRLNTGWQTLTSEHPLFWTDEHANVLDAMIW